MTYANTDDGSYNAEGPAAICVDKPTQYTNAIAGYEEAGLAEPTRNEKQQDLYYLAQAADVKYRNNFRSNCCHTKIRQKQFSFMQLSIRKMQQTKQ